jgi:hypothetical protein
MWQANIRKHIAAALFVLMFHSDVLGTRMIWNFANRIVARLGSETPYSDAEACGPEKPKGVPFRTPLAIHSLAGRGHWSPSAVGLKNIGNSALNFN